MEQKVKLVSLGLTEKEAENVITLKEEMLKRAVKFSFKKKDGTVREAVGTLRRDLMKLKDGSLWTPKGDPKPEDLTKVDYFDIEAQWWRQFSVQNLVAGEA
ncbi:MAG: DUF2693 domain-containing protein [Bacteroidales bacterium]|nr:DUF2693 domain-containing protein [Bacteroidales bacterium]